MSRKKISVVTINYNNAAGLEKTKESIESQTSLTFEWIIIDGGSKDRSIDIIKSSPKVSYYISEKDSGIYDAMYKGLQKCSGDYVLFLNSGDYLSDNTTLNKISDEISNHDVYFFSTKIIGLHKIYTRKAKTIEYAKYSVPAIQQSTIYKIETLLRIEWPIEYKICGDYAIAAQFYSKKFTSKTIDLIVSNFELGGISTIKPFSLAKEALNIQKKYITNNYVFLYASYVKRIITGNIIYLIHSAK